MSDMDTASGRNTGAPPQPAGTPPKNFNLNIDGYKGVPNKSLIRSQAIPWSKVQELASKRDIWVVNNTTERVGKRMKSATSIRGKDGSEIIVTIPDTWIPVNLSEIASNEDIISSHYLREAAAKGSFIFIHPDFAEELMLTEEAQKEKQRISVSRDMSGYADVLAGKEEKRPSHVFEPPPAPAHIIEVQDIRPDFVGAVNNNDMTALLSALTSAIYNEDLKPNEVAYLRLKCSHRDVLRMLDSAPVKA